MSIVLLLFVHGTIECRGAEGLITADTKYLCHLDVISLHGWFYILFFHCFFILIDFESDFAGFLGSPVIPCVCLTSPNTKTVKTLICTAMLYEQSF